MPATGTAPSARLAKRRNRIAPRRVEVVVQVPGAQHRAGLADVDRPAGAGHRRASPRRRSASSSRHSSPAYWRFSNTMSWSWLQRVTCRRASRRCPPSRSSTITKPGPRAQRALGALVADDAVEALERLLGIREPVAVVGVRHVVVRGAASAGSTGPKMPGSTASGSRAPLACRQRAVEHRQAERLVGAAPELGVADGRLLVGHVRHDRDVGVVARRRRSRRRSCSPTARPGCARWISSQLVARSGPG